MHSGLKTVLHLLGDQLSLLHRWKRLAISKIVDSYDITFFVSATHRLTATFFCSQASSSLFLSFMFVKNIKHYWQTNDFQQKSFNDTVTSRSLGDNLP